MFNNISIRSRLALLVSFIILILLLVGLVGYLGIAATSKGSEEIYHGGVDALEKLSKLSRHNLNSVRIANKVRDGVMSWGEGRTKIVEAQEAIQNLWTGYTKIKKTENEEAESEKLGLQVKNLQTSLSQLMEILKSENKERLDNLVVRELYEASDGVFIQIGTLVTEHIKNTDTDLRNEENNASTMLWLMVLTIIIGILVSIIIASLIVRSITTPLNAAVETTKKLAEGDIEQRFELNSKDEVGQLLTEMQRMSDSTKKLIQGLETVATGNLTVKVPLRSDKDALGLAINDMVSKLKSTITEVQSEVSSLASSSQEIVASVSQVSSGTAETAAAVTETTTTVEELKQTAQISAEKAQDVLGSAEDTMKVVKNSEQSLSATINDMNQIQEKMTVISESIVALSKNSSTILEIINTVNDLAEQSNLLAVNAAIEAAKAGDQGKSFGVVAQEIRILAEQSKAATKQVRTILNEIQNSTSAAVMATEQGSKAVTKGVTQSIQTNESISALTNSIVKVAQAAKQIAISSQQQLVGVDQVTVAMTNINEASNQHVEHMKQIEAAVGDLNHIGGTLKNLTDTYKL